MPVHPQIKLDGSLARKAAANAKVVLSTPMSVIELAVIAASDVFTISHHFSPSVRRLLPLVDPNTVSACHAETS